MRTNFYINNLRINEPNNWKELLLELNFDKDNPTSRVSLNVWELGVGGYNNNDGVVLSNKHIASGS